MKITTYLFTIAAALGVFAGCYKPEMVQVSAPEDVIAPVLEAIEGPIEITAENMANGSVEFKWSLADYGVKTEVSYAIEAASSSAKATLTSGVKADTTALNANQLVTNIAYETLNQILFNDLKLADGIAEEVSFKVVATVGEYPAVYSNEVKVSCKVTAAEKTYPTLTVAGSYAYNNWSPGKGQFVFDFDGTDTKYSGMIDFGEDVSALQFKFVGEAWGNNEFSVPEGTEQAAEAAELPLQAGGGDNISAYTTHRYVNLTLDKATPKVIKNFSFNQIGVIGDFNGWGEDVVMQFNAAKQKFYADVDFTADGGFKFRADAGWDVNWGGKDGVLAAGGDNIPVTTGKYRVYVNMNNPAEMTFELNAKAYGTEEGTPAPEPEPEPEAPAHKGWALIGGFNDWAGDLALTSDGTSYVVKGVELEGELKFRKDAAWDVNLGLAEGAEFAANAEIALAANGGNINVAAATYDVYLDDVNSKAWFITDGTYPGGGAAPVASEWGIIGVAGNWDNNVTMYVEGEWIVAKGVTFTDNNEFKFRKGNTWGTELVHEGTVSVDAEYTCAAGGGNSKITQGGTYDVYLAATLDKFYIMTPGKTPADAGEAVVTYIDASTIVVGFSGSVLGWDDPSFESNDRAEFKSKTLTDEAKYAGTYTFELASLTVAANDEFKVRVNGDWIGVGGATVEGLEVSGSDNFVAGAAGTYKVTITFVWDGLKASEIKVVFAK